MFVVVASVIFGIFVSLAYTVFGDTLQPSLVNLFESGIHSLSDKQNGISNRQLVDIETIYKGSWNTLDSHSLLEKDISKGTVKVIAPPNRVEVGMSIPTKDLTKEDTRYILTFKMTLDEGTVTHIGGHIGGTHNAYGDGISDVVIRINGKEVKPENPSASKNDWYSGVLIPTDFKVGETIDVEVEYFIDYFSDRDFADNTVKVQPNRNWGAANNGYGKPYEVTFSKISMLEMED